MCASAHISQEPRCPSGNVSAWGAVGHQVRNPIPLKICLYVGLVNLNLTSWVKHSPAGAVRKFGEGVPAQVSFSSSDRG
ncbi:hypothetical protein AVEN_235272-1 [Araneus ventricosus]|uniref:Uncharacterized protein n=1 Tax=Araneus ventricosus TaxID=182803 RepID=A0A4Y2A4I2_ARAVE|nr:hypothetical protein AVEN_235272-1 [Araneus ventricosus]